jgi:hypothetical protein
MTILFGVISGLLCYCIQILRDRAVKHRGLLQCIAYSMSMLVILILCMGIWAHHSAANKHDAMNARGAQGIRVGFIGFAVSSSLMPTPS